MKKATLITSFMLTCLTVFQSCKKSEDTASASSKQTTLAVELKSNQSYTYTLPAVVGKQVYRIVETSAHSATTALTADANGNMQLVYTPALNYIGSDAIALSTVKSESCVGNKPAHPNAPNCEGKKPKQHSKPLFRLGKKGQCADHEKPTENNILINFNITSDETITTVN